MFSHVFDQRSTSSDEVTLCSEQFWGTIVSIFWNFILLLHYILEANTVHFTPLHLFDNISYFVN